MSKQVKSILLEANDFTEEAKDTVEIGKKAHSGGSPLRTH
jgi:hypothetical protein